MSNIPAALDQFHIVVNTKIVNTFSQLTVPSITSLMCYIFFYCLSSVMYSIGRSIKSPECPYVCASVRPTFLKLSSFHFPLSFRFPFPFPFPSPSLFPCFSLSTFPFPFSLSLFPFSPLSFPFLFSFFPFSFSPFFPLLLSLFLLLSVIFPSSFHSPSPSPFPFSLPLSLSLSIPSPFIFLFPFFLFSFRVNVRAFSIWGAISPKRCKIDAWRPWTFYSKGLVTKRTVLWLTMFIV